MNNYSKNECNTLENKIHAQITSMVNKIYDRDLTKGESYWDGKLVKGRGEYILVMNEVLNEGERNG